jgi:hypothetical protein
MKRLPNGKDPIPRRIWISTKNNLLQQRYGAPLSQNGFHGPTFRKRDAPPFFFYWLKTYFAQKEIINLYTSHFAKFCMFGKKRGVKMGEENY